MGAELKPLEWLLEPLFQHLKGGFSILAFFFVSIIDLCDKVIEFSEDCYNRNCISLVLNNGLKV